MVTVLFCRKDSIYKNLGCDVWDIERDARKWEGGKPAIYHPPCRAWGLLANFAKPRPDEKQLAIWSIKQIQKFGGVLEHPNGSKLWQEMNLPKGQEVDSFGGFTISLNQSWFGHLAEKRTLLYIVGIDRIEVPSIPICFNIPIYALGKRKKNSKKKELPKSEREKTPVKFAKWLIELVELIETKKG